MYQDESQSHNDDGVPDDDGVYAVHHVVGDCGYHADDVPVGSNRSCQDIIQYSA